MLTDDHLQVMVHFGSHAHGLSKVLCSHGQDHEFLHGELVSGVASTINDVKSGYWEGDLLVSSQVSDMAIERNILDEKCNIALT